MGINDLKLIDTATRSSPDTTIKRRQKLLKAIDRQLDSLNREPPVFPIRRRWIFQQQDGTYQLAAIYGSKAIELAKGRRAIACASVEQLVAALTTIRQTTVEGKLDNQIEAAATSIRAGFKKKAK